ncbi:MAG: adenylyl-sulfate kinase [Myxococcales bacterium]|nr:adenylyl-sulfate kinase [Myxococcales bacterium]
MGDPGSRNIRWQPSLVSRRERAELLGHGGVVLWFTGLSGSGKSTVAHAVEQKLLGCGVAAYVLDGDNIRHGLCSDLGFSSEDRGENIRRVGEVARLFVDSGLVVLCAFVSPYRADRRRLRDLLGAGDFLEIFVNASVEACRARDPKGLYARAASGEIGNLTGVGSPYEAPEAPELVLDTERQSLDEAVASVIELLQQRGTIAEDGGSGSESGEPNGRG